jgi:hypothetical protein
VNFLLRLASNYSSPDLYLLSSLDYRLEYYLQLNFLLGEAGLTGVLGVSLKLSIL